MVIGEKRRYLRGRAPEELIGLLREGAATVGVTDVPDYPSELAGLKALAVAVQAGRRSPPHGPGRALRDPRLAHRPGATLLDPDQLRSGLAAHAG